jgi:uncharacterized MAPEG superfamily protein
MPTEVTVLAYAGLLQIVQFGLMAVSANLQLGPSYAAGPRDDKQMPTGIPGRIYRALNNHFEGLILFTLAVVVITLGDRSSPLTETCAWVYLGARVLYVPAYVSGVPYLRSVVWAVGFIATVVMLVTAVV